MLTQTFVRRSLSLTKNLRLRVRSYATMFGDYAPLVITPAQLHDQLKAKQADGTDIVVLDASWHMPNSPRKAAEEFPRAHLPSARFIDIDAVSTPHPSVPHMMPHPATFASACGKNRIPTISGISAFDTLWHSAPRHLSGDARCAVRILHTTVHVTVHSLTVCVRTSYDTHGVFSSPRALYMFRAFGHHRSSILDGGLPGWQAHGGATEDGQASSVASQSDYPPPTLRKDIVKGLSYSSLTSLY